MANESEIRRWNDPRYVRAWPERERLTSAVTPYVLDALGDWRGQRVLDVGCGGGVLTLALAARVGDGEVVGADISEDLLALAAERAGQAGVGERVEWRRLDMQCESVPGPPFDRIASQFGVMFFDEPATAFANVARHLRSGGDLTFACWQSVAHNPWHLSHALSGIVSTPPPPAEGKSATGPFTLGDVAHTTRLLEGTGLVEVQVASHSLPVVAPASAVVDPELFAFMGVGPTDMTRAEEAVEHHLQQFQVGEDAYEFPLAFHIVTARHP